MTRDADRRPIAVGVNGSPASDAAVRYAVSEARRTGGAVRLVHAMPDYLPASRPYSVPLSDLAPTGRQLLRDAEHVARAEWDEVRVDSTLVTGRWIQAILHAAEGAREIVLGHDPAPSLRRVATGSTVIGVAGRSPVPVVVVMPAPPPAPRGRLSVGLKTVEKSFGLLRMAFEQAADRDCELAVVRAWDMPHGYEGLISSPKEREEISQQETLGIEELLQGFREQFPATKASVEVVNGNPARVLELASEASDLLLLARRPHALPRGHIGGTARALLRHSACPVMILPATDEPAHLTP